MSLDPEAGIPLEATPIRGERPGPAIEAHADRIVQAHEEHPQAFLRELRDTLAEQGVRTSVSGLWRFFFRHAITRKKGLPTQPNRNWWT